MITELNRTRQTGSAQERAEWSACHPTGLFTVVRVSTKTEKEVEMALLLALIVLLVLFGVIGGLAITKFLFFVLIVAALLALIGLFTRRTV